MIRRLKNNILFIPIFLLFLAVAGKSMLLTSEVIAETQNGDNSGQKNKLFEILNALPEVKQAQKSDWLKEQATELEEKWEQLVSFEEKLDEQEKRLQQREAELNSLIGQRKQIEENIQDRIEFLSVSKSKDLEILGEMYKKMDPKDSAKLIEQMDPNFSAGLLSLLPADISSQILENVDIKIGYDISLALATKVEMAMNDLEKGE